MKQEIIRLDQLTMGTIKYSDITLIQEKETEIISSDSLWRGIHEYYNGLVKSNIGNGKKVILQIHSKKEFILLFMALIRTGACPIILPVSMTKNSANMLQKICSDNQDAIIMADDMGKVCVQTLLPDIKLPLLSIKEFVCQDENIETDYNDFSDNIADDVAFVIYSSGSTSEPKGVMVTHKGVIRMLQETAKILGLTKEDVLLSWLPVEHTFGLIYFLLLPIYVGCRQVHMATSMFAENPLTWLEQINHYRATVTAGPNFAYQIVLNNMTENCHWDLSCLRYILNGGEPISKKNLHKFLDANKQYQLKENCLIPIYGMTETSGAVVLNVPYREPDIDTKQVDTGIDFDLKSIDILKNDLVCQGKTINGCSIRVVDDFNRDLGQMKVGNIQFKGEFLCKGYLNKDNKDLFADGWLCTGDIGFLSGQNLYIVGRKKDMFFMHGKNIYMRDIEQIIFERYGVRSAACGENNAMEEKSKIYLFMELEISSAEYTKKKKEIIMFIQGGTGIKLSDVIFKDDMFMTQVGKFSKAELLKKYKKQNCPEVNS